MGDENRIHTLGDYSIPSHEGYRNTIELPDGNNVVPLRSDTIRLVQNGCSLRGLQSEEPNQHLKDFLKLVDSLDLDVEKRERTHLLSKITSSCEICNGPHNTQYCMENPEQAFVNYASLRTNKAGGKCLELGKNESAFIQGEMPKKIKDPGLFTLPCRLGDSKPFDTLADLGSCVNLTPLYIFKKDFTDYHLPDEWELARDNELNPFKDILVYRKMVLSYDESKSKRVSKRAFMTLFGQDNVTFTKCSGTKSDEHIISSSSGTYITHVMHADIRPVNDQEPSAELQAKNSIINNLKKQIKSVLEKSNEAKVKHDIDVAKTINIELEHKVAKLLKDNETLKKHYKDLYDSIKEKGFTIEALKNKLRKLIENSVNTKFAKPSILGKPVLQLLRNQSVVRQPTAFRSERPKFSKPRFTSQVDVNSVLSKPVTPYYFPKVKESVFVKPNHVIASGSSRNSSKESYGLNDMAHNYYLEEAKKKTQDKIINLKPSVMHTTSLQNTTNGGKPKPRSDNQTSRSLPVPKWCDTKVNSCAKVQSLKSRNNTKPAKRIPNVNKSERWISKGYRFSPNKSSAVHEKPNTPRSCLSVVQPVLVAAIQELVVSTSTPTSTRIDQDTPTCTLQTTQEVQSYVIPTSVEEDDHGIEVAHMDNDLLLNAACKKALNLLKKGLLIRREAVQASKRRKSLLDYKIQLHSKGSSEGSEVTEKQVGNVQTSLTLSFAKLDIQSMVDVPIHQEDKAVQRTPLIDTIISMLTDKIASTPTPPTTQSHV
uniref:Actin-binding, cofilin/tropomyosin type n=1 Tax=Tanacetum cinerariifolium TaxID=118510 RepID=A0A6L2M6K6_TANCI|nr:actin-binding, cofilin/tropomyosin type [Tanacetum cinerariifolium]